jgi:hypothetical protein
LIHDPLSRSVQKSPWPTPGQPRVPLTGDLSPQEDGEWFLRSVNLFNGGPLNPNPVTCYTCHIDGASDNITRERQAPPLFGTAGTGIQLPNVVEVVRSRPHGHVVAVLDTMRHLGLGRLMVMVVARLLEPRSKLVSTTMQAPLKRSY